MLVCVTVYVFQYISASSDNRFGFMLLERLGYITLSYVLYDAWVSERTRLEW